MGVKYSKCDPDNYLIICLCSRVCLKSVSILRSKEVNFTNILQAAIGCADPESAKRQKKLSVFFALLGSTPAKAAHKMLMKSTLGVMQIHDR